jgi:hypothetical protein
MIVNGLLSSIRVRGVTTTRRWEGDPQFFGLRDTPGPSLELTKNSSGPNKKVFSERFHSVRNF